VLGGQDVFYPSEVEGVMSAVEAREDGGIAGIEPGSHRLPDYFPDVRFGKDAPTDGVSD